VGKLVSGPCRDWGVNAKTNRDSYHDPIANAYEQNRAFTPRGLKRYDPHTRKYRTWSSPNDWFNQGVDFAGPPWQNGFGYPHFTARESRRLDRMRRQGQINPLRMGPEWTHLGPKVCTSYYRIALNDLLTLS
jgi:hypothetical protein